MNEAFVNVGKRARFILPLPSNFYALITLALTNFHIFRRLQEFVNDKKIGSEMKRRT